MAFEWLPGVGVSLVLGGLIWWKNQSVDAADHDRRIKNLEDLRLWDLKTRVEVIEDRWKYHESSCLKKDEEMASEISSALVELKSVAQLIRGWSERQQVINSVTNGTLESLVNKVDKNSEDIASQNSTLNFLCKNFKVG